MQLFNTPSSFAPCFTTRFRYTMMTSSNGNIFRVTGLLCGWPVTGEFPSQWPVTRSFDVFFDLRLNQQSSKQYRDAGDLRRHRAYYDVNVMQRRGRQASLELIYLVLTCVLLGVMGIFGRWSVRLIYFKKYTQQIKRTQYKCNNAIFLRSSRHLIECMLATIYVSRFCPLYA